jgi:solute carrier family 39 (zinc transporter), member 1/2/3
MLSLYLLAFLLLLIGFLGVFIAFVPNRNSLSYFKIHLFDCFARGSFLGLAFMHFLPEAISDAGVANLNIIWVMFVASGCCYLLQFTEKGVVSHRADSSCQNIHWCHYLVFFILILHAVIEGGAIGIASDVKQMLLISLGVGAHKAAACFALASSLLAINIKERLVKIWVGCFVIATPLSIVVFSLIKAQPENFFGNFWLCLLQSIAAGAFLYVAIGHHLSYSKKECGHCKLKDTVWFGFGFLIIALLSLFGF